MRGELGDDNNSKSDDVWPFSPQVVRVWAWEKKKKETVGENCLEKGRMAGIGQPLQGGPGPSGKVD